MWPRDKFEFFNKNRNVWTALKKGEVVEIPDELFSFLKGVTEVEVSSKTISNRKMKKTVEMNLEETTSLDDDAEDAERPD